MRNSSSCKQCWAFLVLCVLANLFLNIFRTHTLILVTKGGHVETIEVSMLPPIDPLNPKWQKTEYQFDLQTKYANPVIN